MYDHCAEIAIDSADNLIVAGNYRGTIDFGGGPSQSQSDIDQFLVKLKPDGSVS
jgi:hypothetical protein